MPIGGRRRAPVVVDDLARGDGAPIVGLQGQGVGFTFGIHDNDVVADLGGRQARRRSDVELAGSLVLDLDVRVPATVRVDLVADERDAGPRPAAERDRL